MMMMKSKSLKDWIDEHGYLVVAKLMKVAPSTVRHWKSGYCLPRSEQMRLIHRYSKGAVTYEEMIETFEKQKQKRSTT